MQRPPLDVCTAREPDGTPTLSSEEDEALVSTAPSVSLFVGDDRTGECGCLYVTNRRGCCSLVLLRFYLILFFSLGDLLSCRNNAPIAVGRCRRVVWFSDARPAAGHSIPFRSIGVHGVCRDTAAFPHACIFAQAEVVRGGPPEAEGEDAIEEDGDDEDDTLEEADETVDLRFVPPNPQDGVLSNLPYLIYFVWAPSLTYPLSL